MPGFSLLGSLSCSSPLIWQGAHWISVQRTACWCCQTFYHKTQFAGVHHPTLKLWKQDIRAQPWKRVRFGYPPLTVALLRGWILPVRDLWRVKTQVPSSSPRDLSTLPLLVSLSWYCLQWSYGPILLPKPPFKMLPLWIRQVKPTQMNHAGSRCWGAWGKFQLPRDTLLDYSIPLTWLHVSAGSQPHHWSTSIPRRMNGGAAWNLASSSTMVLLATGCNTDLHKNLNSHLLKSFFETRELLANLINFTCQREN